MHLKREGREEEKKEGWRRRGKRRRRQGGRAGQGGGGGEKEGKGLPDDCAQHKVPTTLPLLSLRSISEDCRKQIFAGN